MIRAVHGWKSNKTMISSFCDAMGLDYRAYEYNSSRGFNLLPRVTQFDNRKYALQLANVTKANDDALAHSNGCPLSLRALKDGAPFRRMVWVNPALDRDWPIVPFPKCPQLEAVFVLYSKYDIAVKMGRMMIGSEWGDMGAVGPKWPDTRFYSINIGALGEVRGLKKKQLRHSSLLKNPDFWAKAVGKLFSEPSPLTAANAFEQALSTEQT